MGGTRALTIGARTDVGLQREHNEDTFVCLEDLGVFAVIDGVGGEVAGETAARKASQILVSRLSRLTAPPRQRLREAITLANNAIYDQAQQEPSLRGMACVLSVAIVEGECLTVGHVGDTRLYLLGPRRIEKLTRDHSPVGMMEERGELSEPEAMAHPRRSEILRDVGTEPQELDSRDFVDLIERRFGPDEALLLCSDGLTDQVPQRRILNIVESLAQAPQRAVEELVRAANEAGGQDNVTALLVMGERYAEALASGTAVATVASVDADGSSPPPPPFGSAARPSAPRRLWRALGSPRVKRSAGLLGLLALAALLALSRDRLPGIRDWFEAGSRSAPRVLRVGGEAATHASIGAALAAAVPGQVIEVEPGTYDERIELRSEVTLVSVEPRRAVLRLSSQGIDDEPIAVLAEGVRGARLEGFRIVGGADFPLLVGLRLIDSAVEVEDVVISGAARAAVEIAGRDRSLIEYCQLRDNGGAGLALTGPVATRVRENVILGNGAGAAPVAAGVELLEGAVPDLYANLFVGNAAAAVRGVPPELVEEVALRNRFEGPAAETAIVPRAETAPTGVPSGEAEAAPAVPRGGR